MRLALWDMPPTDVLVSGLGKGTRAVPLEIERHDAQTCTELLLRGMVDVALLPSMVVLSNTDTFDVLSGAALSTWRYPFARLVLHQGLEKVESVAYVSMHAQEALVARVILQEHYGKEPAFIPRDDGTTEALLNAEQDASLIVGSDVPLLQTEHIALNLGQEWFELTNYPMVWGLFATRKEEAAPVMVDVLVHAVRTAEQQRALWTQAREMPPILHMFYADDLRLRFDDLAMAGLTEWRQYLYYYNVTDDIPELPLIDLPEDWKDDEGEVPLL